MIPVSTGVITYLSQKNKVPKINKTLSFIGKTRNKNCFLLGFDLSFPGWESTVITCRLWTDLTVLLKFYISIEKVLEQPGKYLTFLKLCKCYWILHPLPRVASSPNRTKTNYHCLYHLREHAKLYHPVLGRSEEKLSTPRFTQENPELNPTTSFFNQYQKQKKTKSWIHTAFSFPLVTPKAKRWTRLPGR